MTTAETVWQEIKNRLNTASSLSYIKAVYEGERQKNITYEMPSIMMEIAADETFEQWEEMPRRRSFNLGIKITGNLDVRNRLDNQIIGDDKQPGMLRFYDDIMKAFENTDFNMSDNVDNYTVRFNNTRLIENSIREVVFTITVKLKFFSAESR